MKTKGIKFIGLAAIVFSLLCLSACIVVRNTNYDPHFTEEGRLIKDSTIIEQQNVDITRLKFYIEVSGSMNGFFRRNKANRFKENVWQICSYYSKYIPELYVLTNNGEVGETVPFNRFQTRMNTGSFESSASTKVPIMIKSIMSGLETDKGEVAVLISDMKYSPVGAAAPQVLLTQYSSDISRIFGEYGKSICLICATSEYIDKQGNINCQNSPYYYFIIGNGAQVAKIRDGISTLLANKGSFIDNIESGFDYGEPNYSFGIPNKCLQFEEEPTFDTYEEANDIDTCTIRLKVDLAPYRWLLTDEQVFKKSFKAEMLYGSQIEIGDVKIDVQNITDQQIKRTAYATVELKVFNMATDSDVIEWTLDLPDTQSDRFEPFFHATDDNDVTKSYSIEQFIDGMFHGGVVNKNLKPNYILVSKKS